MKSKLCAALLAALLLLSLAGCGSGSPSSSQTPDQSGDDLALKYGELLDLTDSREASGIVVVKAKISPASSNDLTISQNYHNAVDLIKNQGFGDCSLQYWAVADMSDGTEDKAISFTVPQAVAEQVAAGDVVATELPALVSDLWVLPSLLN